MTLRLCVKTADNRNSSCYSQSVDDYEIVNPQFFFLTPRLRLPLPSPLEEFFLCRGKVRLHVVYLTPNYGAYATPTAARTSQSV